MTLQRALVLALAFAVAGCGGGGGGGGGADTPPPGGGGGGGGEPTPNGSAEIVFPWTRSAATAPTVTVRGIAADPEGVAGVTVNGVPATLTAIGASGGLLVAKGNFAEGEEEWSAEIDLANGENEVVVSVEDENGDVTEGVDSSTITYVEVPVNFSVDRNGGRLVGLSFTLTPGGYVQHLVQHDYVTGEQTVFDPIPTAPESTCFRSVQNEFLYFTLNGQDAWELREYDLSAREDSVVFEVPPAVLDPGPGFQPAPLTMRLECDANHTSAYLLANYVDDANSGGFAKSRVYEIQLSPPGIGILTETGPTPSGPWIAVDIALDGDTLVAIQDGGGSKPLTSIDLQGGNRTDLTPGLGVWGLALAPALDVDRVYVATFEGVDEIDLSQPAPAKRNISEVEPNHALTFSQVRAIGFDPANSRILVGDEELDTVVAIDLTTGERSEFIARKVGTGTPLIAPRAFALTADGARAYVGDDGGNAPSRLFEIDLATGDRIVVGDISADITTFVTGLVLDEAAGQVYVSDDKAIVAVDLGTGAVETIAQTDATELESITDLMLDADNGRLLVGDFIKDGVYALDLVTREIDVVSRQEDGTGVGPAFGGVISLARVGATDEMYVAAQTAELVTRVDLATGDRELLAHNCVLGNASTFTTLDQVLYDEVRNELLISGDELFSIDLGTGECIQLSRRVFPLEIRTTAAGEMLAVSFRNLLQIDRATGEVVIISK